MSEMLVGITTSLPIEVIIAAGMRPVDLNNLFISSPRASERIELAERRGFPRNVCAWVKGLYGTVLEEGIRTVIGVVQGDCSLTHALLELLKSEGVETIWFDFPYSRSREDLERSIKALEARLGTSRTSSEAVRERLVPLRQLLGQLDSLMADCRGKGLAARAHNVILSGSDLMSGRPDELESRARTILEDMRKSAPIDGPIRLALAGVPPIVSDLFEHVERLDARIILAEMPREFAMVRPAQTLIEQYLAYTYPYDAFYRFEQFLQEVERRRADGIIHYVQSFCFRGVQDRLLREMSSVPVLTLECDRPSPLDGRTVTRLEAFIEMLRRSRRKDRP